jgi:hypothetical protein
MPRVAIIQEIFGKKTTIRNIIQINKLAGKLEKGQKKMVNFCDIFATKIEFVVFF